MKRDFAFVEFSDPRDADDARYSLNGRDVDGSRITVEFAKGVSFYIYLLYVHCLFLWIYLIRVKKYD